MPRKFREDEKEAIRQALLEAAKTMFRQYGIQKTSVAALTEAAGISQGAFYLFFPSKEALFYEVFRMEEQKLKEVLLAEWTVRPLTQDRFAEMLMQAVKSIEQEPILRLMIDRKEYEWLMRKLPPEYAERHTTEDENVLVPLIEQWQDEGVMLKEDPRTIVAVIRSFFMQLLFRDEIGEKFDEAVLLQAKCLAKGLIIK
ncbi:Transcriptional regulator, TetR family protein [Parageobacillus genomosp. 1]|uniref:Transcriptional regulator, TetR family protein n=1 Tax=Parageobacillus genomosp. 1 TaxID=1295642 RepID=A0ABC9VAL9_9BACL|nr:TetR/AcrR family transcriptional regulator [Parageobacillus genomosp. 1]EZP75207.1 Transcriptional regulator, TetR family protein [Parageobacillus genomosp. 1]